MLRNSSEERNSLLSTDSANEDPKITAKKSSSFSEYISRLSETKLNLERYGTFNAITHSKSEVSDQRKFEPWEDEHANLEDTGVRQMALEFNLGLMFGTCLSIIVVVLLDRTHVVPFSIVGATLITGVWTTGKVVLKQAEKDRAAYEYKLERRHLEQYPEQEKEEIFADLLDLGLSQPTTLCVLQDLNKAPHHQARLHTLIHVGVDPNKAEPILIPCLIAAFTLPFGVITSLFPFFVIPDDLRASIGGLFLLGMLSLASGSLLSLKADKSAAFHAVRQFLACITTSIVIISMSLLVKKIFYTQ